MKKIILVFAIVATMFGCNLVSENAEVVKESEAGFYDYYKVEYYQGGVFKNASLQGSSNYPYYFYKNKCLYGNEGLYFTTTKPTEPSTAYQYKKVDGSITTYWLKESSINKLPIIYKIGVDEKSSDGRVYKYTATNNYVTKEYYFNNVIDMKYIYKKNN
jgi:hypothetical protein